MADRVQVIRAAWPRARTHACHGATLAHFQRPSALLALSFTPSAHLSLLCSLSSSRCAADMADKQSSFAAAILPPSNILGAPIRLHLSHSLLHCPLAPSSSTLARRRCSSPPGFRHESLSALALAVAGPPPAAYRPSVTTSECARASRCSAAAPPSPTSPLRPSPTSHSASSAS